MLKRNSKSVSMFLVVAFCLTFLVAGFAVPPQADAAMTGSTVVGKIVQSGAATDLGYFKIEVSTPDWSNVANSELLVSFPTVIGNNKAGITFIPVGATKAATAATAAALGANWSGIEVVVPATSNAILAADIATLTVPPAPVASLMGTQAGAFTIKLTGATNLSSDKGTIFVYFSGLNTTNFAGDVNVALVPQAGEAFGTTPVPLVVGSVSTQGKTTSTVKSIYQIGSQGGDIDTISIFEETPNKITGNFTLQLETKGYTWVNAGAADAVTGLFDFGDSGAHPLGVTGFAGYGSDTLTVTPAIAAGARTATGAITLRNLTLLVDEKVARVGQDIEVKISGGGLTEQTFTIAKYVDFNVVFSEDTTTELIAGREAQKLGTFFMEELAKGTLVADRTILLELPAGVEWHTSSTKANPTAAANWGTTNYEIVNNSTLTLNNAGLLDARTLKLTIPAGGGSGAAVNGAKVKFKNLKVDVSPSFKGDINVTVSGKAGAEGTVKIATVKPMIQMTSDKPKVVLGVKAQKVADVVVTETKANNFVDRVNGNAQNLYFYLDDGFRFASVPKVEVLEGDISLELKDVKIQAPSNNQNQLIIPIRAGSYKTPAKIKISEIMVTADRNAPVGDLVMYAADTNTAGLAGVGAVAGFTSMTNAYNDTQKNSFQYDVPASVAIAENVTVPPVENQNAGVSVGGSASFVIGSNVYNVNGIAKVMDAAPYVKNGRTYVPVRFLGYSLGLSDADIVWDSAAQKATFTKGDNKVELTIGSTTITVNGEAKTMDVAPELSGDRTMLPARFVAEALGAKVGWDPATQTVVVEN